MGTVIDSSRAVVPEARITITNQGTNGRWTTTTSSSGDYRVPFLPVGTYSVQVEKTGFKIEVRSGIALQVDQAARVDLTLEVGKASQTISVTAASPLLNTENGGTGQVITGRQLVHTPLNGRNFLQLGLLSADISQGAPGSVNGSATTNPAQKGVSFSAGGQRDISTGFLMDGADTRSNAVGNITQVPTIDAIQEFKIMTSAYSAQFGASPVQVEIVTKGGGNVVHGTVYEFHREKFLNARNAFALVNLPWHEHNFGGTLGGPIVIPKLYNGKNRSFFFFSYEGRRTLTESPSIDSDPTAAERNGDFSALLPGTVIKDPLTGQPFTGNLIPATRIDTAAKYLMSYWPIPQMGGIYNNYNGVKNTNTQSDDFLGRFDQNIGTKDKFYTRYGITNPHVQGSNVGGNPNFWSYNTQRGQNLLFSETHVFSPTMVNEAHFAYNRSNAVYGPLRTESLASELGWQGVTITAGFPEVIVTGYQTIYDATPGGYADRKEEFTDNLSIHHGRHAMTAGLDWDRLLNDPTNTPQGVPVTNIPSVLTEATGIYSGDGFADLALGYPYVSNVVYDPAHSWTTPFAVRLPEFNFYFQDDWKVSGKLTLNLGLRYDLVPVLKLSGKQLINFDFTPPGSTEPVKNIYNPVHKDFGPRFGFAYRLMNNTSVRGGYGIYYARAVTMGLTNILLNTAGTEKIQSNLNTTPVPTYTFENILSAASTSTNGQNAGEAVLPDYTPTPLSQLWSFTVEHQFSGNMLLSVEYKGSHTTHLDGLELANAPVPGPGTVASRSPLPNWSQMFAYTSPFGAKYESGMVRLDKRVSHGLSMLVSYAWSKTLDQTYPGQIGGDEYGAVQEPEDPNNLGREWGLSGVDQSQRAVASWIYDLPFGKGRALLSDRGFLEPGDGRLDDQWYQHVFRRAAGDHHRIARLAQHRQLRRTAQPSGRPRPAARSTHDPGVVQRQCLPKARRVYLRQRGAQRDPGSRHQQRRLGGIP